jgi:hypothetical protein
MQALDAPETKIALQSLSSENESVVLDLFLSSSTTSEIAAKVEGLINKNAKANADIQNVVGATLNAPISAEAFPELRLAIKRDIFIGLTQKNIAIEPALQPTNTEMYAISMSVSNAAGGWGGHSRNLTFSERKGLAEARDWTFEIKTPSEAAISVRPIRINEQLLLNTFGVAR